MNIVDIDGVVLEHGTQFFHWLDQKGVLKGNNESEKIAFLYQWHHNEPTELAEIYAQSGEEIPLRARYFGCRKWALTGQSR